MPSVVSCPPCLIARPCGAALSQGIKGNGTCSCAAGFGGSDCKCGSRKGNSTAAPCASCPPFYSGPDCTVCPGNFSTVPFVVTRACSGHGVCEVSPTQVR